MSHRSHNQIQISELNQPELTKSQQLCLPHPPQIFLKKIQPTNYEEDGKWYISPNRVKTELQKLMLEVEQLIEQQLRKGIQSADEEAEFWLNTASKLRKANQLNKIVNDASADLYISFNLGHLYHHLKMPRFSEFSYEKALRILNQLSKKYKYLELIPSNYFSYNAKFYNIITQRYWLHLTRGKVNLSLAAQFSTAMKHQEAYSYATESYLDFAKAAHELLIVFLGNLIKFMVQHKFKIKKRPGYMQKHQEQQQAFLDIEYQNYKICINTLNDVCKSEAKDSNDPKVQMLKTIIAEQTRTIAGYTEHSFGESIQGKEEYLPENLRRMRFLNLASPKELEKLSSLSQSSWMAIKVEVDLVYELALYLTGALYSLSIEAKFLKDPHTVDSESAKRQLEILNELDEGLFPVKKFRQSMRVSKINGGKISESEHWLSRALQLSHKYIPNTSLFFQIKNVYTSTYGAGVEHQIINEVTEDNEEATFVQQEVENEESRRGHTNKQTRNYKRKSEEGRATMTAPNKAFYPSWRFSNIRPENQKLEAYEVKTLKKGREIPMVIRKSKDEEGYINMEKDETQKRERKFYIRSLQGRPDRSTSHKKSSHKKKKWETNMDHLKKIYDNQGPPFRLNQKIQYLDNDAPYRLSDKFNTVDLSNPKSKNITNARYDFKHHKPLGQSIDLY